MSSNKVQECEAEIEINYLPLKIVARFTCLLGNNHSE